MRKELTQGKAPFNIPVHQGLTGEVKNIFSHFLDMFDLQKHGKTASSEPKIEVTENPDSVLVSAELPGIDEKDIDLQISADGNLTITGERKHETEKKGKDSYFSEIYYGMVQRTIPLPWDLNYEQADADFNDGVLKISFPKTLQEKQKVKKINLKNNKNLPKN